MFVNVSLSLAVSGSGDIGNNFDELYPTMDTCNLSTVARLKINLTGNRLSITSDPGGLISSSG